MRWVLRESESAVLGVECCRSRLSAAVMGLFFLWSDSKVF